MFTVYIGNIKQFGFKVKLKRAESLRSYRQIYSMSYSVRYSKFQTERALTPKAFTDNVSGTDSNNLSDDYNVRVNC